MLHASHQAMLPVSCLLLLFFMVTTKSSTLDPLSWQHEVEAL